MYHEALGGYWHTHLEAKHPSTREATSSNRAMDLEAVDPSIRETTREATGMRIGKLWTHRLRRPRDVSAGHWDTDLGAVDTSTRQATTDMHLETLQLSIREATGSHTGGDWATDLKAMNVLT